MTSTTATPAIDAFAKSVRTALKDLGAHEVSELTEGLEADLAAQADEQGESFELPDPADYAAELRDAAGLPNHVRGIFGLVDRFARVVTDTIAHSRIASSIVRFLGSLGPVWWLLRGYAAFFLWHVVLWRNHSTYLPNTVAGWAVLVAFLFVSIQLGRRTWRLNRFWTRTVGVLNLFAVIVTPLVVTSIATTTSSAYALYESGAVSPSVEQGLHLNSQRVDNIFVYDANGNPLTDVQLFTQDGDPLSVKFNEQPFPQVTYTDSFLDMQYIESPRALRGSGWNVFPLTVVPLSDAAKVDNGEDVSKDAGQAPLPFPTVAPLKKVSAH